MMFLKPISLNVSDIFLSLMEDPRGKMEKEAVFMRMYRAN
jgi:hypothetical protein